MMFELEAWSSNKVADHLSDQLFSVKTMRKRKCDDNADMSPLATKVAKMERNKKPKKHKKLMSSDLNLPEAKRQKKIESENDKSGLNATEKSMSSSVKTGKKIKRTKALGEPSKVKSPRNKYKHLALNKGDKLTDSNPPGKMKVCGKSSMPEAKLSRKKEKTPVQKSESTKKNALKRTDDVEENGSRKGKKPGHIEKANPQSPSKDNKRKRKRKKKNNPNKNKYRHLILAKLESGDTSKSIVEGKEDSSKKTVESDDTQMKSAIKAKNMKSHTCSVSAKKHKNKSTQSLSHVDQKQNSSKQKAKKLKEKDPTELPNGSAKKGKNDCSLKNKMTAKLNAARFRYLNEQLYTQTGEASFRLFRDDQEAFKVYHSGFQGQVDKWPSHPLDSIIKYLKSRSASLTVADFGCGDARLAQSIPNQVYSFDLVALNSFVTPCDMAKVPLDSEGVDVCVFCLSLMGTNLVDYLREANRVLKTGGVLKVAEVNSRFRGVPSFVESLRRLGFQLLHQNTSNKMFILLDFKKVSKPSSDSVDLSLMPCVYRRR